MSTAPQPARPDRGVELLERALAYTRGALASITSAHLSRPTPCTPWRLSDLLAHMEDSLDAFTEGADGAIGLQSAAPAPVAERVMSLQTKACHLLGAWAASGAANVDVGGRPVPVDTIAHLAALEITVHGWDVARSTGYDVLPPADLADRLLATAVTVALERSEEFAPALPVSADADPATRLLALVGRRS